MEATHLSRFASNVEVGLEKFNEGQDRKHPIDTIIDHAGKLEFEISVSTFQHNKENQLTTYLSCRN